MAGLARCAWKVGDLSRACELFEQLKNELSHDKYFTLTLAKFEFEQAHVDASMRLLNLYNNESSVNWTTADDRWCWLKSQILQHRRQNADALDAITAAYRLRPRDVQHLQTRLA